MLLNFSSRVPASAVSVVSLLAVPIGDPVLPLTGERTVPGVPEENYWFRRHEAAYQHLLGYCRHALVRCASLKWPHLEPE